MNSDKQQAAAAQRFAQKWQGKGYEKGDSQIFWTELLTEVFGIEDPSTFIRFEEQVKIDKTNFIDTHLPATKTIIEQKSLGKDLRAAVRQSDGSLLNPFQQAKRYAAELPYSERPRWIVTCNFSSFLIYDMEQPNGEPEEVKLKDLGHEYYRLQFLVDNKSEHLSKEMQVSMQAGEIVGKIYSALLEQYMMPFKAPMAGNDSEHFQSEKQQTEALPATLRWLNILCVRIVFCLYAEDAGVFGHDQFHDYLAHYDAEDMRQALMRLFEVLNTPDDRRSPYLKDDLKAFPYTNGGLFEEPIEIPQFTEELKQTLLQNASLDFDWSEISPTIFGAVFESTLNPDTRRAGGMHYTSIENIHKVIDPLFLDRLRSELNEILQEKNEKQRRRKLDNYQERLASLKFLDPACGSGNFLTETYLSLRRLENEVIRERYHGQTMMGVFKNPIKVSIRQFYGIEINDFAVTVATTALWISEAQMLRETERIIHQDIDFLPLKSYTNIREGNALRMDWAEAINTQLRDVNAPLPPLILEGEKDTYAAEYNTNSPNNIIWDKGALTTSDNNMPTILDSENYGEGAANSPSWQEGVPEGRGRSNQEDNAHYDYIIGNPPFCGRRYRTPAQIEDVAHYFNYKDIDYVACWYKKAAMLIQNTETRCAFVSTNSITQGEQVPALWGDLNVKIDFARRTFRWDSEASQKAHVHCVIIGFSASNRSATAVKKLNYPTSNEGLPEGQNYSIEEAKGPTRTCAEPVMNTKDMKDCRRSLRNNSTTAEKALWKMLKGKQVGGLQFRRQFSVSHHVLDFYCPTLRLAIELDGDYHYKGAMPERDLTRDEELLSMYGIRTLRFENKIVIQQPEAVINQILQEKAESVQKFNAPQPPLTLEGETVTPIIYDGERAIKASNINGYLLDAPDVYIGLRSTPLCNVPTMKNGNVPLDGDALKVEAKDVHLFADCKHLLRRLIGGRELLHNEPRYVLWLVGVSPNEIKKFPQVYKRVELCRNNRLAMKDAGTRRLADSPTTFRDTLNPDNYIALPMVSSERRRYIPMDYFHGDTIPTNQVQIIPNATLYHFGVLMSNVHMAWMRAVCGRLKSDYRYSKDIVYNNFPWPLGINALLKEVNAPLPPLILEGEKGTTTAEELTSSPSKIRAGKGALTPLEHKVRIERTAQAILDARALYPDSSLADLYDELTMPPELRKAHQENDRAVMMAYGFPVKSSFTESQCVAELFKKYEQLTSK